MRLHRVDQAVDRSPTPPMAVRNCWVLAGTGTRRCTRRASQTCSMGDMSGEYAGHGKTGAFSASRNCIQVFATWVMAADE